MPNEQFIKHLLICQNPLEIEIIFRKKLQIFQVHKILTVSLPQHSRSVAGLYRTFADFFQAVNNKKHKYKFIG
jgi:hypothetical protein